MPGLLDRLAVMASSEALPVKARVLLVLLCHADKDGRAWPSAPGIARRVGSTPRVVRKVLDQLAEAGLVQLERRGKGGRSRGMSVWVVSPCAADDAWQALVGGESAAKGCPDGAPFRAEERCPARTPFDEKGCPPGAPIEPERVSKSDERVSPQDPKGCPPRTPEPSKNPVQPNARVSARGSVPDRESAAARPAEAPPSATQPESGEVDEHTLEAVTDALMETRYRAVIPFAVARRSSIRKQVAPHVARGLTVADVHDLVAIAKSKSNGDYGALLSRWLDSCEWLAVRDHERMKRKERDLRPPVVIDESDPVLGGSGSAPAEPKTAKSVLRDVMRGVEGA